MAFPTRRITAPFVLSDGASKEMTKTYAAYVGLEPNEVLQHCSFSFVGDKKDQALRTIVESISFADCIDHESMDGTMLADRNALRGVRSTYDMSHNRTHMTVFNQEYIPKKAVFRCKLVMKLLTPQEL